MAHRFSSEDGYTELHDVSDLLQFLNESRLVPMRTRPRKGLVLNELPGWKSIELPKQVSLGVDGHQPFTVRNRFELNVNPRYASDSPLPAIMYQSSLNRFSRLSKVTPLNMELEHLYMTPSDLSYLKFTPTERVGSQRLDPSKISCNSHQLATLTGFSFRSSNTRGFVDVPTSPLSPSVQDSFGNPFPPDTIRTMTEGFYSGDEPEFLQADNNSNQEQSQTLLSGTGRLSHYSGNHMGNRNTNSSQLIARRRQRPSLNTDDLSGAKKERHRRTSNPQTIDFQQHSQKTKSCEDVAKALTYPEPNPPCNELSEQTAPDRKFERVFEESKVAQPTNPAFRDPDYRKVTQVSRLSEQQTSRTSNPTEPGTMRTYRTKKTLTSNMHRVSELTEYSKSSKEYSQQKKSDQTSECLNLSSPSRLTQPQLADTSENCDEIAIYDTEPQYLSPGPMQSSPIAQNTSRQPTSRRQVFVNPSQSSKKKTKNMKLPSKSRKVVLSTKRKSNANLQQNEVKTSRVVFADQPENYLRTSSITFTLPSSKDESNSEFSKNRSSRNTRFLATANSAKDAGHKRVKVPTVFSFNKRRSASMKNAPLGQFVQNFAMALHQSFLPASMAPYRNGSGSSIIARTRSRLMALARLRRGKRKPFYTSRYSRYSSIKGSAKSSRGNTRKLAVEHGTSKLSAYNLDASIHETTSESDDDASLDEFHEPDGALISSSAKSINSRSRKSSDLYGSATNQSSVDIDKASEPADVKDVLDQMFNGKHFRRIVLMPELLMKFAKERVEQTNEEFTAACLADANNQQAYELKRRFLEFQAFITSHFDLLLDQHGVLYIRETGALNPKESRLHDRIVLDKKIQRERVSRERQLNPLVSLGGKPSFTFTGLNQKTFNFARRGSAQTCTLRRPQLDRESKPSKTPRAWWTLENEINSLKQVRSEVFLHRVKQKPF